MNRLCAVLLGVLVLAGCDDKQEREVLNHRIAYFQDYSTGLCFADITTIFRGLVPNEHDVTAVECTEKVRLSIRFGR